MSVPSTELEVREAVSPATGEIVDLTAPTESLASTLDDTRTIELSLREFKRIVGEEVLRRMDRARKWSLVEGGYKLRAPSDAPKVEWDVDRLAVLLTELVDQGQIDKEAMDAALEQKVEWKVRADGINRLRKNPKLAEAIDGCSQEVEPTRYVSVQKAL